MIIYNIIRRYFGSRFVPVSGTEPLLTGPLGGSGWGPFIFSIEKREPKFSLEKGLRRRALQAAAYGAFIAK